MQDHREIGATEERVHAHKLVVIRGVRARDVVANIGEIAVAVIVVRRRAAEGVDTDRLRTIDRANQVAVFRIVGNRSVVGIGVASA